MDFRKRYVYNTREDLLGKGGFSRVFRATDVLLEREVALKVFNPEQSAQYDLITEIKKVIKFQHENLCRYYDVAFLESVNAFGEEEQVQVGVMEYLDGGELKGYLKNNPQYLNKLLCDVLKGLSYLHKRNIIHRDLKPQNILIKIEEDEPIAKITDFGISKAIGESQENASALVGTVEYMAPEQFNPARYGINGQISTHIDLWSFGIMVYELIKGENLFGSRSKGTSAEIVMTNILNEDYLQKLTELPKPYDEVVALCLKKMASERAASADVVLDVLKGNVTDSTLFAGLRNQPAPGNFDDETTLFKGNISSGVVDFEDDAETQVISYNPSEPVKPAPVIPQPAASEPVVSEPVKQAPAAQPAIPELPKPAPVVEEPVAKQPAVPEPVKEKVIPVQLQPVAEAPKAEMSKPAEQPAAVEKPVEDPAPKPVEPPKKIVAHEQPIAKQEDKQPAAATPAGRTLNEQNAIARPTLNESLARGAEAQHAERPGRSSAAVAPGANPAAASPGRSKSGIFIAVAVAAVILVGAVLFLTKDKEVEVAAPVAKTTIDSVPKVNTDTKVTNTKKAVSSPAKTVSDLVLNAGSGNESVYSGKVRDGVPDGKGLQTFANGSVYNGNFSKGLYSGKGSLTTADGDKYVGNWSAGIKTSGTLYYKDGSFYKGSFKRDLKHGSGKLVYKDGSYYEGGFANDQFSGSGKMFSAEGEVKQSGTFKDGVLQ
ncbi:serine/threonine-protein kinase [Pedobacter metabolipauper]|uniref:non-specific serine/threonine protein kinase n=1 Tax=Pedobacter metabolipauper TaxID=425513 RepID=A0A4R6SUM8_9SPHI|nr:serine/threonine-protein kinase [Pedobacter metabolipauper]TDQ09440.1 serine/threonine protein kinase [Pedobacter metabolipauper]